MVIYVKISAMFLEVNLLDYVKFTDEEINSWTNEYMERYNDLEETFKYRSALTSRDISLIMVGAAIQCARWYIVSHDLGRLSNAYEADRYVDKMRRNRPDLGDIISHSVPYDAIQRSSNFQMNYPGESVGLSGTNHRLNTFGHDPIFGLIFGTMNIATNTLTTTDFNSYIVVGQQIDDKTSLPAIVQESFNILKNDPKIMGGALIKQVIHMNTDVFTTQGLPLPGFSAVRPDLAKFMAGNQIDTYSTSRAAMLAIAVNKVVEMIHKMYFDPNQDNAQIYAARTAKVILYSNTLASLMNAGYIIVTKDFRRLDLGGFIVTLKNLFTHRQRMRELRENFINDMLSEHYQRELDESKRELERMGIYLPD